MLENTSRFADRHEKWDCYGYSSFFKHSYEFTIEVHLLLSDTLLVRTLRRFVTANIIQHIYHLIYINHRTPIFIQIARSLFAYS